VIEPVDLVHDSGRPVDEVGLDEQDAGPGVRELMA
jgi:hypothetical protein